MSMVVQTAGL